MAKNNYSALKAVKTKKFKIDGIDVYACHNPARISSSSASVDKDSVERRKCFLCKENLPPDQQYLTMGNLFFLLVNPFPLSPIHFTIVSKNHKKQTITDSMDKFIRFAADLEGMAVFYNGPDCGASAPDHLHFQAISKDMAPLLKQQRMILKRFGTTIYGNNNLQLQFVDSPVNWFYFIRFNDTHKGEKAFYILYNHLSSTAKHTKEPMLNIICIMENNYWDILLFPRKKHRPPQYYFKDERHYLFSPASAEMAGLCIFPLDKDFEKINKFDLRNMLNIVCTEKERLDEINNGLREELYGLDA